MSKICKNKDEVCVTCHQNKQEEHLAKSRTHSSMLEKMWDQHIIIFEKWFHKVWKRILLLLQVILFAKVFNRWVQHKEGEAKRSWMSSAGLKTSSTHSNSRGDDALPTQAADMPKHQNDWMNSGAALSLPPLVTECWRHSGRGIHLNVQLDIPGPQCWLGLLISYSWSSHFSRRLFHQTYIILFQAHSWATMPRLPCC